MTYVKSRKRIEKDQSHLKPRMDLNTQKSKRGQERLGTTPLAGGDLTRWKTRRHLTVFPPSKTCQFIGGDYPVKVPVDPPMCGKPTKKGYSYCEAHAKACYRRLVIKNGKRIEVDI